VTARFLFLCVSPVRWRCVALVSTSAPTSPPAACSVQRGGTASAVPSVGARSVHLVPSGLVQGCLSLLAPATAVLPPVAAVLPDQPAPQARCVQWGSTACLELVCVPTAVLAPMAAARD
jgi:hypothetical protein